MNDQVPERPIPGGRGESRSDAMAECRCYGTGIVQTKRKDDPQGQTGYAFLCPCPAGNRRNKAFPVWRDSFEQEYDVIKP